MQQNNREAIRQILIFNQEGMDEFASYAKKAIEDVMNCFPDYKDRFPIKIVGNWKSGNYRTYENGKFNLTPYESIDWYIEQAKKKAIEEGRWEPTKQINVDEMCHCLLLDPYFRKIPQFGIYLTKYDLYSSNASNYCLGQTVPGRYSIISTNRFWNETKFDVDNFKTVIQHEFGHILLFTNGDRPNVKEVLGPHCTVPYCIMQQRMNGDMSDITKRRIARKLKGFPPMCPDCAKQGLSTLDKVYEIYKKKLGGR